MVDDTPKPKTRRSRAELEELMIEAGVEVLAENGIEMQISSVSYAKVFEHLERTKGIRVTYGSVHERIWDSLQEYQLSVIERAGVWSHRGDDAAATHEAWCRWLRTMVSMGTQPDGSVVAVAAAESARRHYADRERRLVETGDPRSRRSPGRAPAAPSPDELSRIMARLSIAVADGLDLRRVLTGEGEPVLALGNAPEGNASQSNAPEGNASQGDATETWTYHALAMYAFSVAFGASGADSPG